MIHLVFDASPERTLVVGPAPFFRFVGGRVCCGNVGSTVAGLDGYNWNVDGARYPRIECQGLVRIELLDHLSNVADEIGPIGDFRVLNTYVCSGRRRLAKFSPEKGLWSLLDQAGSWPVLRIVPAD
jgi:hypothetical protein